MNISAARKSFLKLKTKILADGKVDIIEAQVLLDFIKDYTTNAGKNAFNDFKKAILDCIKDNVITKEESDFLIDKINEISTFLKIEQIIEWIFIGIVLITVFIGLLTII